jgi:hypothetical protein
MSFRTIGEFLARARSKEQCPAELRRIVANAVRAPMAERVCGDFDEQWRASVCAGILKCLSFTFTEMELNSNGIDEKKLHDKQFAI